MTKLRVLGDSRISAPSRISFLFEATFAPLVTHDLNPDCLHLVGRRFKFMRGRVATDLPGHEGEETYMIHFDHASDPEIEPQIGREFLLEDLVDRAAVSPVRPSRICRRQEP